MPLVEPCCEIDALEQKMISRDARISDKLDEIVAGQARLFERTEQHEKRMDRAERQAVGYGSLFGLIGGVIGGFLKGLVGGGSSS